MYYRRKPKKKLNKVKLTLISLGVSIIITFTFGIYYFDRVIEPTVMLVADAEMRARVLEIVNKNIYEIYENNFNYDELVTIEKDSTGKITMVKADTVKLNALATQIAIQSQQDIKDVGSLGVKIPLGYITKNNIISYWGPSITVKMVPIGRVQLDYDSTFESAGINQTRHKIYIKMKCDLNIILPLQRREVQVRNEIPVSETIIVGEIPENALGWGFMSNNDNK